jgi:hypothetical protein
MKSSQMDTHISIRKSTCVSIDSLFIYIVGRFVQLPQNIKTRIPFDAISIAWLPKKTFANFLGKFHHMPQKLLDFVHLWKFVFCCMKLMFCLK